LGVYLFSSFPPIIYIFPSALFYTGADSGKIIRDKAKQHPLTGRYLKDFKYRTRISLYQGMLIKLLYITVELASGIYYRSWWFVTLAVYYALLAVMRFLLIWRWGEIKLEAELRRYRLCGIMLLMNQVLAGMVILMVYQDRGYLLCLSTGGNQAYPRKICSAHGE